MALPSESRQSSLRWSSTKAAKNTRWGCGGAPPRTPTCARLLNNLIERGLDSQLAYLFIIDGSKALRKAIRIIFGSRGIVQRCQEHKLRNVLGHLPKSLHPSVNKTMRDAYRGTSKATARKRLMKLVTQLESDHPDAVESLREGIDETITLKDWNLPASLASSLAASSARLGSG